MIQNPAKSENVRVLSKMKLRENGGEIGRKVNIFLPNGKNSLFLPKMAEKVAIWSNGRNTSFECSISYYKIEFFYKSSVIINST